MTDKELAQRTPQETYSVLRLLGNQERTLMNVDNNDISNRVDLAYVLGNLMDLNIDGCISLLKRFKAIESNRELINSLPKILEDYF